MRAVHFCRFVAGRIGRDGTGDRGNVVWVVVTVRERMSWRVEKPLGRDLVLRYSAPPSLHWRRNYSASTGPGLRHSAAAPVELQCDSENEFCPRSKMAQRFNPSEAHYWLGLPGKYRRCWICSAQCRCCERLSKFRQRTSVNFDRDECYRGSKAKATKIILFCEMCVQYISADSWPEE